MVKRIGVYRGMAGNLSGRDHLEASGVDWHIIIIVIKRISQK